MFHLNVFNDTEVVLIVGCGGWEGERVSARSVSILSEDFL